MSDNEDDINFNKELVLFYFAYRAFIKQEDEIIQTYNIRAVHRRIIFFVGRMPGLTVNELLEVLDITKQALNMPMNELLTKELVKVEISQQDKRRKQVYLTSEGLKLDDRLNSYQINKMKKYFEQSGDPDGKIWSKVMELYASEIGMPLIDRIQ